MRLWSCDNLGYELQDGGSCYGVLSLPQIPDDAIPPLRGAVDQQLAALVLAQCQRRLNPDPLVSISPVES